MENTTQDWRTEVSISGATLKIKDNEIARLTFLNEGERRESKDFGTSIAFKTMLDGDNEPKTFYVKTNNFAFLAAIKELGKLTGLHVEISRKGSTKSTTRYAIKKI